MNPTNPTTVQFQASAQHADLTSYELQHVNPDGTFGQTYSLGKPTPNGAGVITTGLPGVMSLPYGEGYRVRIRGTLGTPTVYTDWTVSENSFNRRPSAPTSVQVLA